MKFLSLDPGESCGLAVWNDAELTKAITLPGWDVVTAVNESAPLWAGASSQPALRHIATRTPADLLDELVGWELLVVEDWALYPWELQNLGWDKCRTARLIGALELIAYQNGLRIELQPAKIKSEALAAGAEHLFDTPLHPNRHQNDAIMHGVWYLARSGALAEPTAAVRAQPDR